MENVLRELFAQFSEEPDEFSGDCFGSKIKIMLDICIRRRYHTFYGYVNFFTHISDTEKYLTCS
jgi:hypothetical protein